ncbi:hypothetical protein BC939DRAFT_250713 [Gamsiella multidivaricata]|uniref:uncharacterized protein n=1 Tax=Gamsiella multidivaricata TaxID=101098 RepID=UPI00221F27BC|nr:uncharacterized protein BC939DRAFT_250713 [Gamsiella multidivaricata]KAI7819701.1 hypothetical protein BC939DRAFT_250713 [Gamsiella multidivaricata]
MSRDHRVYVFSFSLHFLALLPSPPLSPLFAPPLVSRLLTHPLRLRVPNFCLLLPSFSSSICHTYLLPLYNMSALSAAVRAANAKVKRKPVSDASTSSKRYGYHSRQMHCLGYWLHISECWRASLHQISLLTALGLII